MDSNGPSKTATPTVHLENTQSIDSSQVPVKITIWKAVRMWSKVTGYCLALTTAILLWGYDMAMVGNLASLPEFQKDYGTFLDEEWIIPSKWMSAWNAASPIGMTLGALAGGVLLDRWGRRLSLGLGSISSSISVAILWASQYSGESRQGVFMLGKLAMGLSMGVVVCTVQTYMSETLPSTLRGPLLAFLPLFFLVGQLISAFIVFAAEDWEGSRSYRMCIISQWPFSGVPVIVALLMPESPVHLIRKGKLEAAFQAQSRLDNSENNTRANIDELQAIILHEQEQADSSRFTFADCFKGTDRRRTIIVVFTAIAPQLFGLSILGDGPYFLQVAGVDSEVSLIFLIAGIAGGLIATIISMWLLTVVGRRSLSISTLAAITLLWMGMGIAGSIESSASPWYVGVTLNLVTFIAALGVWPAAYVVASETSSLRLRAKTQGVGWAVQSIANFAFSAVTPLIYNADAGNLRSKIGFVWTGICAITLLGFWYLVPEMLGRTPIQLDLMFEQRVATRKFPKWVGPDSEIMHDHGKEAL